MTIRYRRSALAAFSSRKARITLSGAVPWTIELQGGLTEWLTLGDKGHVYWAERGGRKQTIVTLRSAPIDVAPEDFERKVRELAAVDFRGVNVTIPHKEAALRLADTASPEAEAIGAAPVLQVFREGDETGAASGRLLGERVAARGRGPQHLQVVAARAGALGGKPVLGPEAGPGAVHCHDRARSVDHGELLLERVDDQRAQRGPVEDRRTHAFSPASTRRCCTTERPSADRA